MSLYLTDPRSEQTTHLLSFMDGVCVESDSVGRAVMPDGLQHVNLFQYMSSFAGLVFDFVIFTPFCYFCKSWERMCFAPGEGRVWLHVARDIHAL